MNSFGRKVVLPYIVFGFAAIGLSFLFSFVLTLEKYSYPSLYFSTGYLLTGLLYFQLIKLSLSLTASKSVGIAMVAMMLKFFIRVVIIVSFIEIKKNIEPLIVAIGIFWFILFTFIEVWMTNKASVSTNP